MNESIDIKMDEKNIIVMKLLHYFITEKNYAPIILQGAENEIWLENLEEDVKIVRLVSIYIHNNEQLDFDTFKTKRIMNKIKKKTLSLKMNALSIFLNLGENVNLSDSKNILCVEANDEEEVKKNKTLKSIFPDLSKKLKYTEDGVELFVKITNDINSHNKTDADKVDEVFRPKYPMITYMLITANVLLFFLPVFFNKYDYFISNFAINRSFIQSGEYYRLITGAFLHGSIFHLLFNCYALYIIGSQLESFIGKFKYLIVYFFSALTASLLSIIFSSGYSIGASGAIFGLMGSLVYFGYHYRVYLGNIIKSQIIPLILLNLLFGFVMTGIDNAAHIGGLIGGVLITTAVGIKYKSSTFEKVNGYVVSIIYLVFLLFMALGFGK